MSKLRWALVVLAALAMACGASLLIESEGFDDDGTVTEAEELRIRECLAEAGLLDAGAPDKDALRAAIRACLADAGFVFSRRDGGFGFPLRDGGVRPPCHGRDGGPFPGVRDGGLASFLTRCGTGCACSANQRCVNPMQQTCPARFAVCVPN